MPKEKKRPSKTAKAAQKLLSESKLLAATKVAQENTSDMSFRASQPAPRLSTANKLRPEKKKG